MSISGLCHNPLPAIEVSGLCKKQGESRKIIMQDNQRVGIKSLQLPSDKLLATFINQMVASAFELPPERLLRYERGNARATRARQISIYLMHTTLSFSLSTISRIYSKDRTTIGYACRVIEDLRDKPAFDDRIIELENTINTVLKLASYVPTKGGRHEK